MTTPPTPEPSPAPSGKSEKLAPNARVTHRLEVAPGLFILRVAPEGWELPTFKAGQYGVLGLPGSAPRCAGSEAEEPPARDDAMIRRAYSIASSSMPGEYLEFYIALVRSGALTPRLYALNAGDRVFLSPRITGMFTLDEVPPEKHIVLIATGTGLAPYMSMLRTRLHAGRSGRVAVLHGARHSWDLGYRAELEALQHAYANLTYIPIISEPEQEPQGWTGDRGFINALWGSPVLGDRLRFQPDPATTHVFLCGNPLMITAMMDLLRAQGYRDHSRRTPGEIHTEKYW